MRLDPTTAALVALVLSAGGWGAKALTAGGAMAASLVGFGVLAGAGWPGAAVLGAFFVLSSALGRLVQIPRAALESKGERRDQWQVLANGGAAALGGVLAGDPAVAVWIVTASLAAAGADTWATAIGSRSGTPPRLLLLGPGVQPGTNGGMTLLGTAGAVAGAGMISAIGALATGAFTLAAWGTVIGTAGMTLDSLLGATLQGRFHCDACGLGTEWRTHRCGRRSTHTGGLAWLTNDGVNAVATTTAALAGWLAWRAWAS
jgi:uncharacterized protein (TIGR00297 family)